MVEDVVMPKNLPALWSEDRQNESALSHQSSSAASQVEANRQVTNQPSQEKDSLFPSADEGGWNIWDLPIQQQPPGIHALLDNLALSRQVLELESDNAELKFKYEEASRVFYEEVSIMREIVKALLRLELPNSAVLLKDGEEQGIQTIFPETASSRSHHSNHFLQSSSFESQGSPGQQESPSDMSQVQHGGLEFSPSDNKINFDTSRASERCTGPSRRGSRYGHPCDPIQFGRLLLNANDAGVSHWPSRQELQEWCEELQAAATHSQYPTGYRRMYGKSAAVMDQWSSSASSSPVDCGTVQSSFHLNSLRSRTKEACGNVVLKQEGTGGESEQSRSRSNSGSSVASTATTSPRNRGTAAFLQASDTEESSRRENASGASGRSAGLKNRRRGRRGGRKHANRRRQAAQQPATSSDYDLSSISLNHWGLSENLSMSMNRSASPSS